MGRTINPVNGATGLLLAGNWKVCQSAVETVLSGGALEPLPEYSRHGVHHVRQQRRDEHYSTKYSTKKRPGLLALDDDERPDLDLSLKASSKVRRDDHDRAATPSSVEDSETTTLSRSGSSSAAGCTSNGLVGTNLLRLFI